MLCQSCLTGHRCSTCTLIYSKWLPIHDCLAIGSSKWLPIYLYLAIWLHMLLDPVQSRSVVLKMASISFELLIWQLIAQNGCQSKIFWSLAAQNGCHSTYTWPFGSTCSLIQSRADQLCSKWLPIHDFLAIGNSKWLPIYFYLITWLHMLLGPVQTWSVLLKMAAILLLFSTTITLEQSKCGYDHLILYWQT